MTEIPDITNRETWLIENARQLEQIYQRYVELCKAEVKAHEEIAELAEGYRTESRNDSWESYIAHEFDGKPIHRKTLKGLNELRERIVGEIVYSISAMYAPPGAGTLDLSASDHEQAAEAEGWLFSPVALATRLIVEYRGKGETQGLKDAAKTLHDFINDEYGVTIRKLKKGQVVARLRAEEHAYSHVADSEIEYDYNCSSEIHPLLSALNVFAQHALDNPCFIQPMRGFGFGQFMRDHERDLLIDGDEEVAWCNAHKHNFELRFKTGVWEKLEAFVAEFLAVDLEAVSAENQPVETFF